MLIPIAVSVAIATVAYGGVPDMQTVGTFAVLYLTVPAFWVALTIALGTFIKSASGIAGIGFAVIALADPVCRLCPARQRALAYVDCDVGDRESLPAPRRPGTRSSPGWRPCASC